jgi:D-alanyl-D-alanine carboxypeptidase
VFLTALAIVDDIVAVLVIAEEWLSDPTRVWKPEDLARIGIKESPLFEPGTGWFYSNTNYVLLGLVLEKVTGKPIGKLYQKEIIEPLHLKETSFPNTDSALPEPYDHDYTLQGKKESPLARSPSTPPTGAPPRHGRPAR